jgi:hypothetical protein
MEDAMAKRKWLIVGIALAAVACAVPVVAFLFRDPVNQSACERIQEGMTEAEVIRILGRPGESVSHEHQTAVEQTSDGNLHAIVRRVETRIWNGPAGSIQVDFKESGTVQAARFDENGNSVWPKVRRTLWSEEEKVTVPSPYYLCPAPQNFPPSPPYPLPKELESSEEAAKKAYDNPQPE